MSSKTTGKAGKITSGRVRRKKKKITNSNLTTACNNKLTTTTASSITAIKPISSISSINSSINSVLNSNSYHSDTECSTSSSKTSQQQFNQLPQLDNSLNNSINHHHSPINSQIYCDNLITSNKSYTNGQYLNQSTNSSYNSPFNSSYYNQSFKTQLDQQTKLNQFNHNNLSLTSNLDHLNNSLNQYLPKNHHQTAKYCANKDTKTINKLDRTMMDCKPLLNPNLFANSTNQLNLTSNIGGTFNAANNGKLPFCCGCGKAILDRFLLQTMNTLWHEDCLKCKICDCRLGEVGSSLFTKSEMLLCKRDYLR